MVGNRLLPFAIFALLVEVNSVFLHTRRLMRMLEVNPKGVAFKVNRVLNVITFIVFRFVSCGWVAICLVINRHSINQFSFAVGFIGLVVAILQNFFLFKQVWSSDAKSSNMSQNHLYQSQNGKCAIEKDYNANVRNGSGSLKEILRMTNNGRPSE